MFLKHHLLEEVVLEEGAEEIGVEAFRHYKSLRRDCFPPTLLRIGARVCRDCILLSEVVM